MIQGNEQSIIAISISKYNNEWANELVSMKQALPEKMSVNKSIKFWCGTVLHIRKILVHKCREINNLWMPRRIVVPKLFIGKIF